MADDRTPDDENNENNSGASPHNPLEAYEPEESSDDMNRGAPSALYKRMQYFYKNYGYKDEPDEKSLSLVADIEAKGKELMTILADGRTAIRDNGKRLKLNTLDMNDDAAQVLASQILAKKWSSVKLLGNKENKTKLAAMLLALDPNVKFSNFQVTAETHKRAEMLRETRGLDQKQKNSPHVSSNNNNSPDPSNGGNTPSPNNSNRGTSLSSNHGNGRSNVRSIRPSTHRNIPKAQQRDFPLSGQESLENHLSSIASTIEEGRDPSTLSLGRRAIEGLAAISTMLDLFYKASPDERALFEPAVKKVDTALKQAQDFETSVTIIEDSAQYLTRVYDIVKSKDTPEIQQNHIHNLQSLLQQKHNINNIGNNTRTRNTGNSPHRANSDGITRSHNADAEQKQKTPESQPSSPPSLTSAGPRA